MDGKNGVIVKPETYFMQISDTDNIIQNRRRRNRNIVDDKHQHAQHQHDLFDNFIDFKKAFDRVWHNGLWCVLRSFNIEEGLVQGHYTRISSAILINNQLWEFFRTTVGVRQGCLLSLALFNTILDKYMQDTLQDHHISISLGRKILSNLRSQSMLIF